MRDSCVYENQNKQITVWSFRIEGIKQRANLRIVSFSVYEVEYSRKNQPPKEDAESLRMIFLDVD